jgi:(E)-4-hydroxy-3-methylbut-2-enyl-diphosphate synthase
VKKSHHITADDLVDELERMVRAKVKKQREDEEKGIIARSE